MGVGPGASDLMTLRSVAVLRAAEVLVLPRSSDWGESMAWKIAAPNVGEVAGQERLFLTFPMSRDPERVRAAWRVAIEAVGARLAAGQDVAFVTEGDPSLYSTFVYLAREAPARWPSVRVEIVPGVTSVTAVPAVAGVPLADGRERVAILPAGWEANELDRVLASFDTVVLMRIGPRMPEVVESITRAGLLDRAVYVRRATMADQVIERDLRKVDIERGDCFAMVVVAKGERRGLLSGELQQVRA